MARIDAAYDYFLTTYGQSIGSRYESHKKSELRDTYNKIVRSNKESPLYKITQKENAGQLAIDIKEHANDMSLAVSALTNGGDDISAVLDKRIAISSDPTTIEASYVGDGNSEASEFNITVQSLATPQINQGRFLNPGAMDFEEGQYSFDLETRSNSYEFQFNINSNDNNHTVLAKLSRLVNSADIGLSAELVEDNNKNQALEITSKSTGLAENEDYIFNITSNTCWRELNTLGIGNITSAATNSSFTLNGTEHQSMSNTFTVNKAFELTLQSPTEEPVTVGLMADTEALSNGINGLLSSYNGMVGVGIKAAGGNNNNTLTNEVTSVAKSMGRPLAEIGITSDENGYLSLDDATLSNKINSPDRAEALKTLNDFASSITRFSTKASINPLNYLNKIVVEYKNPNKTFAYPYAASQYSGMFLDYGL